MLPYLVFPTRREGRKEGQREGQKERRKKNIDDKTKGSVLSAVYQNMVHLSN